MKLLRKIGFRNIQFSKPNEFYDLTAFKENKKYFIEVRYVDSGIFSLNDKLRNLLKLKKNKWILFVLWSKNDYVIKSLDDVIEENGYPEPVIRNRIFKNFKDYSALVKTLGATPNLLVIDFFLDNRSDYSKKEIIQNVGMSKTSFYKIWNALERMGIVEVTRRYGNTNLFTLNEKNDVVQKLMILDFALGKYIMGKALEEQKVPVQIKRHR